VDKFACGPAPRTRGIDEDRVVAEPTAPPIRFDFRPDEPAKIDLDLRTAIKTVSLVEENGVL
jgi:hypothetical protein